MSSDPAPAVSYWEKSKVDEAFSKGAVLFDGSDGRNYMVHASRREKPGQAEIHTKDADVIYVLQGSATFITGGEAIDAKTTAPDEIRGSSIRNGQTRQIAKGDVDHRAPRRAAPVSGSNQSVPLLRCKGSLSESMNMNNTDGKSGVCRGPGDDRCVARHSSGRSARRFKTLPSVARTQWSTWPPAKECNW